MRALQRHRCPQRRFQWVLWLVLLMPLAQVDAAWHEASHVRVGEGGDIDGKQALHLTQCDLCLTATVVAGGGLISEPPAPQPTFARHTAPLTRADGAWASTLALAYSSRAPPCASR